MSEPIQSIAQKNYILSTQQEVSHDSSLSGNGTVDSPLGVVPGYNETVLWSGDAGTGTNLVLSENYTNFDRLRFEYRPWSIAETPSHQISEVGTTYNNFTLGSFWNNDTTFATFIYTYQGNGTNQLNFIRGAYNNGNKWTTAENINMFKVVGINRISG